MTAERSLFDRNNVAKAFRRALKAARLPHHSPLLHLIQQIRDETHRFAVTFHRQRRAKRTLRTDLDEIPGVGPRTAQKLLQRFGSVAQIRAASVDELSGVVSRALAERIAGHVRSQG